eukprot:gene812-12090_t
MPDHQIAADVPYMPDSSTEKHTAFQAKLILRILEDEFGQVKQPGDKYEGKNISEAVATQAYADFVNMVASGNHSGLDETYDFGYSALMHLAACPHDYEQKTVDGHKIDLGTIVHLQTFLILAGCNVNHLDNHSKNALHACGKFGGSVAQAKNLLAALVDPTQCTANDGTSAKEYFSTYERFTPEQIEEIFGSGEKIFGKMSHTEFEAQLLLGILENEFGQVKQPGDKYEGKNISEAVATQAY